MLRVFVLGFVPQLNLRAVVHVCNELFYLTGFHVKHIGFQAHMVLSGLTFFLV